MVAACFRIRAILAAMVGNHAGEADRLRVEEHLATCESCRQEKARWLLVETLRDQPPVPLSTAARERVLSAIIAAPKGRPSDLPVRRVSFRLGFAAAAVACAMVLGMGLWALKPNLTKVAEKQPSLVPTPAPERTPATVPTVAKETIVAENPGALAYGGARIRYQAGTSFRVLPRMREVELVKGELDVDVTPGLPGRFRVACAGFSVEVLGTHFIVGSSRVQTLHGKVRILDATGKEVAMLTAGQSWQGSDPAEPPSVGLVAAPTAPAPAVEPALPSATPARMRARPATHGPSVDHLLSEARAVLGAGNPAQARARIEQALDAEPTRRQRAIAELLAADTLLVESKYPAALAGYRRTLALFEGFPEAETAAYAIAQLLTERGASEEANLALSRYLDRYPQGRFKQEAARKLASLSRP